MLDKGVHEATRGCLFVYGRHRFRTEKENSVADLGATSFTKGGSSKVDYVFLVDDDELALCEAKSPSVMHEVGHVLPERGIELKWFRGQSLIPKIFANVSTPFPISYNTGFQKICVGRFVFRSETYGMAISYLP